MSKLAVDARVNRENLYMSYKSDLLADLKDLDYAAKYLSASIKESIDTFLTALRDVVDAQN